MLDDDQTEVIAAALHRAFQTREAIPPPSLTYLALTSKEGYAVQALSAGLRVSGGARHVGYKVGLTSRTTQAVLAYIAPRSMFRLRRNLVHAT